MVDYTDYVDTKTTDEDGKATLQSAVFTESGTRDMEVVCEDIIYPTSVEVVEVSNVVFGSEEYLVAKNQSIVLDAVAYNGAVPIPNLLMTINNVKTITDENGRSKISYMGQGNGEVEITAKCGYTEATTTVMDYLMYWKPSENRKYNVDYSLRRSLTVLEMYSGIRLSSEPQNSASIYFTYPNSQNESWTWEFTVKSFPSSHIQICGYTRTYTQLKANDTVKVVVSDGSRKIYINDNLVDTETNATFFVPYLVIVGQITIDDIKLYKVI